jgi:anti-sigma B factor antagonist
MSGDVSTFCLTLQCGESGCVLSVRGEIDLARRAELQARLRWVIEDGSGDVELDLAAVTYIDSSGLYAVLNARDLLGAQGRTLRVVQASPQVAQLFRLCAVSDLLGAADGVEA